MWSFQQRESLMVRPRRRQEVTRVSLSSLILIVRLFSFGILIAK